MVASIPNDIFQFSTYSALAAGFTLGQPRTSDLTTHGTDGLGVYEDGSLMILLDEQACAIRKEGTVVPAPMNDRLAFAMVTIFRPTHHVELPELSFEGLEELMESSELGPARGINTIMPFKMRAKFSSVSLGTGGTLSAIEGTIFGFVVPKWMRDTCGPRIQAYFLNEDESKSGRVEGFEIDEAVNLGFAKCGRFHLGFPQAPEWEDVKIQRRL
jgi:alpha-acetolactate decarboxylase